MPSDPKAASAAWQKAIREYIATHPDRPQKARGLARELGVPNEKYAEFRAAVRELIDSGAVTLGRGRTLTLPAKPPAAAVSRNMITGVFRAHPRGFGFIEAADRPDVFVRRGCTGDALDGDIVEARLARPNKRTGEPRAEIVRVIEHAETNWVGILERDKDTWFVQPMGKTPAPMVLIEDPTAKSARPGDMVLVDPIDKRLNPRVVRGVIVERLGEPSQTQVKVRAVAARYGLPEQFEASVRQAARDLVEAFDESAFHGREDLRSLLTVTIDPPDARDFDDAISIEPLPGGLVELGVHIADVAHFVRRGATIDVEAHHRGNSTYFPGYVVPMLPEILSNGVCSLQPNQPRLTKSVFIRYDRDARVAEARFANSVIESDARLSYVQAQRMIDGQDGEAPAELLELLRRADKLARRIQQRRRKAGMITLALPEVEIRLDEQGNACDAGPADTSFTHTIIEMFMVEANEAVCRLFAQLGVPHIRRIHPEPDPDALVRLNAGLSTMGIRGPKTLDHRSIQQLLDAMRGKRAEAAVNYLLLRSLAQATYSPAPLGHFALASRDYTHFTSPIRRYPDLLVHRLLDGLIREPSSRLQAVLDEALDEAQLVELGRHTSATERRSQQAEREARQWLLVALMAKKVGETFDGIITGAASIGVFVQIQPYLAEGLVRTEDFGRDDWEFDDDAGCFIGRRSGRLISFGQPVRVRLASVDEYAQELVFVPESPDTFGRARGTRGVRGDGGRRTTKGRTPAKRKRPATSASRRRR